MKDRCDIAWTEQERIINYSPTYYITRYWLKKILKNIKGKVLDIGCGICTKVDFLKGNKDITYLGIDHSTIAIKKAKERGFNAHVMSATKLHFKNKFDYILSIGMLEHIKEDEKVIEECRKNLKKGGKFILETTINKEMFGPMDIEAGHYRRYNPTELIKMIKKHRLKVKKVYYTGFPMVYAYRRIQSYLGKRKGDSYQDIKYVPKGHTEWIPWIMPVLLPLFKVDCFFYKTRLFQKYCRGIIIVAYKV